MCLHVEWCAGAVCVCVFVCMHTYMHVWWCSLVHAYARMYDCCSVLSVLSVLSVSLSVCLCVCCLFVLVSPLVCLITRVLLVSACGYVSVCVCLYVCLTSCMFVRLHACLYVRLSVCLTSCLLVYECMCAWMCACMHWSVILS